MKSRAARTRTEYQILTAAGCGVNLFPRKLPASDSHICLLCVEGTSTTWYLRRWAMCQSRSVKEWGQIEKKIVNKTSFGDE